MRQRRFHQMRAPVTGRLGLGDGEAQFLAMGANIQQRPSAFEEAFDIIKRLLAGETVSSQGRFVLENARVPCVRQLQNTVKTTNGLVER